MSHDSVVPILCKDSRICDISDKVKASAYIGSKDNSFYSYAATTASKNSVNVTCALPSESVVFDRLIFIGAKVNFQITYSVPKNTTIATNTKLFNYGKDCAFQPFPLNGMIANNNVKVNSVSFNMAQDDLQNVLLRTQDINNLARSNMVMSPAYSDNCLEYNAAYGDQVNCVLKAYNLNTFSSLVSRGSHPISDVQYFKNTTLINTGSAGGDQAAFKVSDTSVDGNTYTVKFSATFFEPLLLSPFIFSSQKMSRAGLTNVSRLTFNLTIDNLLRNVWSQLPIANLTDVSPSLLSVALQDKPFDNFAVYINCLTPQITDLVPPVSVLPCISYERYISSVANLTTIKTNESKDVILNNLVLNQIPEMIYVVVRKVMSATTYLDAKSFFSINNATVNFMNAQGMLSNCNQQLLWKISRENGVALNWYEWSGVANGTNDSGTHADQYLTGSILAINPSKDLSLNSPYIANGTVGNFNLQIKLNVTNYYSTDQAPEIMIICKNSCYLKNMPGGSSTLTLGYFDMKSLSDIVTKSNEEVIGNADVANAQKGGISDQMLGGLAEDQNDVDLPKNGSGYRGGSRAGG